MPDPKTVSIGTKDQKIEFQVPQPYAEGHVCSANEAKVLNQVRAENIGNNARARVQATILGEEGAMSQQELLNWFTKYANEYQFTEAAAGTGRATLSPLEREARKVATAIVIQLLSKDGRKRKDVPKEDFESEVARFADTDKVQKLAARNLKDAEKLVEEAMQAAAQ